MQTDMEILTEFEAGDLPSEIQPDHDAAAGEAYRTLSLDLLRSLSGAAQSDEMLEQFYDAVRPSSSNFSRECEAFESDYYEAKRIQTYIRVCEELSNGDPLVYQRLYLDGDTEARRQVNGGPRYNELCQEIPVFSPVSREKYFESYQVVPLHEHKEVFYRVLEYTKIEKAEDRFSVQGNNIRS